MTAPFRRAVLFRRGFLFRRGVHLTFRALLQECRYQIVMVALQQHDGNVVRTARALGLQRTQLQRMIRVHALKGWVQRVRREAVMRREVTRR